MNKKLRTIFQYTFFFGLGIFLAWWSIRDLSAEQESEIRQALKSLDYRLVPPVIILLGLSHFARGLRWKLLIDSLGYKVQKKNTFFGVLIGYFTNEALPRFGEILKCTILSRYEKIPVEKLIGTIILERVIDALCLILVFIITLAIQPDLYTEIVNTLFYNKSHGKEVANHTGQIIFFIIIGIALISLFGWMIVKKKNFTDIRQILKKAWQNVLQGVGAIRHLKRRWEFILLTIAIWSIYLLGGYIGFLAFKETRHYGIPEAFTVLSAGSIGMIATPGGIGAYPIMLQQGMMLYGLEKGFALAYGWALWLAQVVTTTFGGILSFILMPLLNKKTTKQKPEETNTYEKS
ncbi:MAG: flippase-like domain-containing protein [Bacteroidetes bacterium]|nr:flippase-like domain-containing protein [Bacteroidota bacterium]